MRSRCYGTAGADQPFCDGCYREKHHELEMFDKDAVMEAIRDDW